MSAAFFSAIVLAGAALAGAPDTAPASASPEPGAASATPPAAVSAAGAAGAAGVASTSSAAQPPAAPARPAQPAQPAQLAQILVGPLTRSQVESAAPAWIQAGVEAHPDPAASRALASVEPGAEVTVFLGTWCSDSRREVSRLWRAFDDIGIDPADPANGAAAAAAGSLGSTAAARALPFTLRYIGVDEAKQQPAGPVAEIGLKYVPTFVVCRNGREVGRIVESSPHGVESDLLDLLSGRASGLLTASAKLAPAKSGPERSAPPPDL
ncbi:MAG TPA: hypothetical protein VHR45_06100 [Thermoanaerobaculia bacterium]|nr:hypothetical protein [Thermoanaerobaculia bacterium]